MTKFHKLDFKMVETKQTNPIKQNHLYEIKPS